MDIKLSEERLKIIRYDKLKAEFKPWTQHYLSVAAALIDFIRTAEFDVIHIGSTSAMVGGKGIIDLSLLYKNGRLDAAVTHLKALGFQDQVSCSPFPAERPRKDGALIYHGTKYYIHIHAIADGSDEHRKQLQYKEYLLAHPAVRLQYEESKQAILATGICEQEAYGKQKSPFVKAVLSQISP